MLIPLDGLNITRRDVRRSKIASFAINMLVNLGKFIRHEQRDVAAVERERAFPNLRYEALNRFERLTSTFVINARICAIPLFHIIYVVCVYVSQ